MRAFEYLVTVLTLTLAVSRAAAEDSVIVSGPAAQDRVRRTGEILDYTGTSLTLRTPGGSEAVIPAERVIEVQTEWSAPHRRGDELFAEGKFSEALQQYREAARQEKRPWVRRRLIAQAVWCYRYLDQPEYAAGAFLTLTAEDPATHHFDAIPLAWTAAQPDAAFENRLQTWLSSDNAPAALIAASWLLPTRERSAAAEKLRELASHSDRRIAILAEAQLWRTRQAAATVDEVARWKELLERIPEPLRAGPYFLIGQEQSRLGGGTEAALTLLRVPVLYPQHRDLAAEALWSAGRELERLDRHDEAQQLVRELASEYPESQLAELAKGRLQSADGAP